MKYVTREHNDVDNYVDDLVVPKAKKEVVIQQLGDYGLLTKPCEPMHAATVLGLKLAESPDGVQWSRRNVDELGVPERLTKRKLFSWCGKLTSHYPVCAWLRPRCSWLKRLSCRQDLGWDADLGDDVQQLCSELADKLAKEDPVRGIWHVNLREDSECSVWCDASGIALGVVITVDGRAIEDACWLRQVDDKRHINISELDAAIEGLTSACKWNLKRITLCTDSKSVAGMLKQIVTNSRRIKVGGLHELLVQRRLQIVQDIIAETGITLSVMWVPSEKNLADQLTRGVGEAEQTW